MKNKVKKEIVNEARVISLMGQKKYAEQKRRENISNNFKK